MKAQLKKDIKIDDGGKLHKATEGIVIGVSWGDKFNGDMLHIIVRDKRYLVEKADCDIYG
jgi:hypothetical protein